MADLDFVELLAAELEDVRQAIRQGLHVPDDKEEAGGVALVLLRQIAVHAEAVLTLARTQYAEAAIANLRTLFEAWLQLRYLLVCAPDMNAAAAQCQAFAMLELSDWLKRTNASAEEISAVDQELSALRARHAPGVAAAENIRNSRQPNTNKNYWTGMRPTKLVEQVASTLPEANRAAVFYKFSSWEAHVIMAPVVDLQRLHKDGELHLRLGPPQLPSDVAQLHCSAALEMLQDAKELVWSKIGLSLKNATTSNAAHGAT